MQVDWGSFFFGAISMTAILCAAFVGVMVKIGFNKKFNE